jgi:putative membrane protein
MKIETVRKITFATGVAGLSLLFSGALFGQGTMGRPQGNMPGGTGGNGYPGGQNPGTTGYPNDQTLPPSTNAMSDADFAKKAAAGGIAEVKMGQLAQEKGSSEEVKNFGKKMVDDHTQANDKLKEIASQQNIKLPSDMDKHDRAEYNKLSKLSGDAFDKEYTRDMIKDHRDDISDFQDEAKGGQNEAIKNFASETLPTLEMHLKMAREAAQTVGSSTGTKSSENR